MKTITAFLLLASVVRAAPPTESELLQLLDGFDARAAELPNGQPKTDINTAAGALRMAIMGLPDDPAPEPLWTTIDLPEGRKIVTHLGLIPDLSADVTHTLESGPFPQDLPANARVLIPAGVTVDVGATINARVESIAVQGTLRFARDLPTMLKAGTILVYPGGKYDHGSEDDPVAASSAVVFDGRVDTAFDPEQIIVGLVAFGGEVTICGDFLVGTTTTELSAPAAKGATTFAVNDATGWKVGDEIQLADSQAKIDASKYVSQCERRYITGLNLNQVTVFPSLLYAHDGDVDHLTRNVRYDSAPESDRGHIILQGHTHVHVCCVRLDNLGRTRTALLNDTIRDAGQLKQVGTNQRGRYPLHAHHLSKAFHFDRVVVVNKPEHDLKWGITHHNCYGDVTNCVVVDAAGAGIVGESGAETGVHSGNSVTRNILKLDVPDYKRFREKDILSRFLDDRGFGGFGMWYRGPFIEVVGNKVNGRYSEAYSWNSESGGMVNVFTVPDIEGTPPELRGLTFDCERTPIRKFDDNRCHTCGTPWILWGFEGETENVVTRFRGYQQAAFGIGFGCGHVGTPSSLLVVDSEFVAGWQNTNYAYVATDSQKRLALRNVTLTGWLADSIIAPKHAHNLEELVVE